MKPIIVVCVLTLFLLTGCFNPFKAPMNEQQDLRKLIEKTQEQIKNEQWEEAKTIQKRLQIGWGQIRNRVSLNASSSDITDLDISIEQLTTYIEEKERALALAELGKLKQIWEGIARL